MTANPKLPKVPADLHKGTAGRVLIHAGSAWMPGAAILACRAAQRAGAGLVFLGCGDEELQRVVPAAAPETVLVDFRLRCDWQHRAPHAWLIGPGLGQGPRTRERVFAALEEIRGPLVLDADALNLVAAEPERLASSAAQLVLTPHPGEAARLLGHAVGEGTVERAAAVLELAARTGAIVCLKGPGTLVCRGDETWSSPTGNPGLASGGTGDVLAGILVAYLARVVALDSEGCEPDELVAATRAAVWVHGRVADRVARRIGTRALIASDLIASLGEVQAKLGNLGESRG